MKKILFILGLGLTVLTLSSKTTTAQISVNIGAQPLWGPVGYDRVDYYYLPDVESYYYVPTRQFVYLNNGRWVFGSSLPSRYNGYDLYRGYKVVINQPRPYMYYKNHKVKYGKYKGYYGRQPVIRYSNDSRYYAVAGHPKYKNNKYYNRDRDDWDDDKRRDYYNYDRGRDNYRNANYKNYKGKSKKGGKD